MRKRVNTNPQLRASGDFYPTTAERDYWLGESYEQELRDANLVGRPTVGIIAGLNLSGTVTTNPGAMKGQEAAEGITGWVIGQDLGDRVNFVPENMQKIFKLKGRGHGEWLHKNLKVSIEKVRQSQNSATDYGTFSVVIRMLRDTDNAVQRVGKI